MRRTALPAVRKRPKMGTREDPRERAKEFLGYLRRCHCTVEGYWYEKMTRGGLVHRQHVCKGKVQAAHLRKGSGAPMQRKPDDCHAIPLCFGAHIEEQHVIGEAAFDRRYGINSHTVADGLWERWLRETDAGRRYREKMKEAAA